MDTAEVLTWLAGILSMFAVYAEAFRGDPARSVFTRSTMALPFYAAGIAQWFLYGVKTKDPALLLTCALQFYPLAILLKRHWRARVPA